MKKVFLKHLRPDYCWPGTKEFFLRHGIDPDEFLRNGISADRLIETKDLMAIKLAERAIEVEVGNGQQ